MLHASRFSPYCFFFFKQKTSYELRISDWSSDVCSSDLIISELLPQREGGHRYSNSDPVTGQAAWYDLRVRLERCLPEEAGETDPLMAPVKAPPPRGLDDGGLLRYGADLKSAAPAPAGRGSRFMEWIGNRTEVSPQVAGVADGKGDVKKPALKKPGGSQCPACPAITGR